LPKWKKLYCLKRELNDSKIAAVFFHEDKICLAFSLLILILQIYFGLYSAIAAPLIGLAILLALIYFQSHSNSKLLKFFRSYIHIPFYGIIFTAFQTFAHKLNPTDYDQLLLKIDSSIFSFDITVWFQQFISRPLTELLTLSYFSYYVLPTLTFLLLFILKTSGDSYVITRKYLLAIVLGWYFAFVCYIILPAAGPDIAFPQHYAVQLIGLSPLTNGYLESIGKYLREAHVRNTFPSMHFGIILITNYFAFRFRRKYFLFCTLPIGILLGTATLYLRQHYLIDLVGSFFIAAFSIYTASKLIKNQRY
jgi:membrane-associated phospholipid phosphatase